MNPLLNHPLLAGLPYHDLHNPTIEGIRLYLSKKRKSSRILKWLMIFFVAGAIAMSLYEWHIQNPFILAIAIGTIVRLHQREKKYKMSDGEIEKAIKQHDDFQGHQAPRSS